MTSIAATTTNNLIKTSYEDNSDFLTGKEVTNNKKEICFVGGVVGGITAALLGTVLKVPPGPAMIVGTVAGCLAALDNITPPNN